MDDFDPFKNQGGQAAWDPEHAADPKKQADELSRRLAADDDELDNGPSTFSHDDDSHSGETLVDPDAEVDSDDAN